MTTATLHISDELNELASLAITNADPRDRDEQTWSRVTDPARLSDIVAVLLHMRDTNLSVMDRKRLDIETLIDNSNPDDIPPSVASAVVEYDAWLTKATSFGRKVDAALREVWLAEQGTVTPASVGELEHYRSRVRHLEAAIRRHRDAVLLEDTEPEEYDTELWVAMDGANGLPESERKAG